MAKASKMDLILEEVMAMKAALAAVQAEKAILEKQLVSSRQAVKDAKAGQKVVLHPIIDVNQKAEVRSASTNTGLIESFKIEKDGSFTIKGKLNTKGFKSKDDSTWVTLVTTQDGFKKWESLPNDPLLAINMSIGYSTKPKNK